METQILFGKGIQTRNWALCTQAEVPNYEACQPNFRKLLCAPWKFSLNQQMKMEPEATSSLQAIPAPSREGDSLLWEAWANSLLRET